MTLTIPPLADPRYLVLSLSLIFAASVFFIPLHNTLEHSKSEVGEAYGQSLANSAARESVEAMFRNDLVGLRAIAQSIADNPFVLRASMRTIDQQTLVQAGPVLHELPENARTFEASITLQDSMAAIATVTIAVPSDNQAFLKSIYVIVMALSILLALGHLFSGPLQHLPNRYTFHKSQTKVDHESPTSEPPATQQECNEVETPTGSAYLSLCVKNVSVLKHQLNGETFRNTFQVLNQKINKVGRLYGSTESRWQNDRYIVSFKSHDPQSALFNAACAGRILLDSIGIINRVPLDLSAEISHSEHQVTEKDMPFVGLAIDTNHNPCEYLESRVEYLKIDANEDRKLISKFLEPYSSLLNKQMDQFREGSD